MIVKVLGPGCKNCKALEKVTHAALAELDMTAVVEKVEDYPTIAGYGVMSTPALVIDDQVVVSGHVPTVARVCELLSASAAASA